MKKSNLIALVLWTASSLFAAPELFESIAAIVDGKPIMRSEVMENLYQFQNTAEASEKSEKEQIAFVLDRLIDDKVLLSRVDRDSIRITLFPYTTLFRSRHEHGAVPGKPRKTGSGTDDDWPYPPALRRWNQTDPQGSR